METSKINLKECPPAGEGNHSWLFYAACKLTAAGLSDEEAGAIMIEKMSRKPQPTEIADALCSARRGDRVPARRWPRRNMKKLLKVAAGPLPQWPEIDADAETAIDFLYPGNPLLCVGQNSMVFNTKPREFWRGKLNRNALIVPSPMSSQFGKTQAGHLSMHTLDNTGPRHYLVIENDWAPLDNQMKFIAHLSKFARLVCACSSGGKSVHGYFDMRGKTERQALKFMDYAVHVTGADPRTWLKSQFCRLPGGTRETGKPQTILFLANSNPKTIASNNS